MTFFNPISVVSDWPVRIPLSERSLNLIFQHLEDQSDAINLKDGIKWFIEKVKHPIYQELYLQLYRDKKMQAFLESGDLTLFDANHLENSTRDKAYFLFWKPFFLIRLAPILAECVDESRHSFLDKLFKVDLQLSRKEQVELYKEVTQVLDAKVLALEENLLLDGRYSDERVWDEINTIVCAKTLNSLPKYFQMQIDAIGKRLVELSIYAFNEKGLDSLALKIVALADSLQLSMEVRDLVTNSLKELSTFVNRKKMLVAYKDSIDIINHKLDVFRKVFESLPEGKIPPSYLLDKVKTDTPFNKLRGLSPEFHYFISEFLGLFRAFGSYSWNSHTDYDHAKALLLCSYELPLGVEQEKMVREDLQTLKNRFDTYNREKVKQARRVTNKQETKKARSWGAILLLAVFVSALVAIINNWDGFDFSPSNSSEGIVSNSSSSGNRDRSNWSGTENRSSGQSSNTQPASSSKEDQEEKAFFPGDSSTNTEILSPSRERATSASYLTTGDSPFDSIFGTGLVSDLHQNWILFKNESDIEVIVCLEDLSSGDRIRNEYINAGEQLRVSNIPNGEFTVLVYYGLRWSSSVVHDNGRIKGGFQERSGFCKFMVPRERIELYDINGSFTSLIITFKEFGSGSNDQTIISEQAFFD